MNEKKNIYNYRLLKNVYLLLKLKNNYINKIFF